MVDFALNEDQQMMKELAHDFAEKEIRPLANRYYRQGKDIAPEELEEVLKKANFLRLMDYYYPEELGGLGIRDRLTSCLIAEELFWGDAGIAAGITSTGLAAAAINAMGSDEQKRRWLPMFCNPNNEQVLPRRGAFCLTEAEAGSYVLALSTTARRDGDSYLLNGAKQFITNGGIADLYVVVAQTNLQASSNTEKALGLAGFVVEKGTPGLSAGKEYDKWGVRATNTTEVVLDEVRVPLENRLGVDRLGGQGGMVGVYTTLEATRVGVAAAALGVARAAYETALQYAQERVQKRPIIRYQAISHRLAEMETQINAARTLLWKAAWMVTRGISLSRGEGSQAKLCASEVAIQVALEAVRIHGGYGFIKEYDVGRWLNDALVFRIWEGTSEIQRNTIARYISGGGIA